MLSTGNGTARGERDSRLRRVLLEEPGQVGFDLLARLAARIIGTPIALVTILDADRQYFKSCLGLPEPWQTLRETDLAHSFCRHVVETGMPLVIEDAREHPLVRDNPAIQELTFIAYLGIPIGLPDGAVLGSFCVIDTQPRKWTQKEIETMQSLAHCVVTEIELRAAAMEAQAQGEAARREHAEKEAVQQARYEAEAALALLDTLYLSAPIGLALIDPQDCFTRINAVAAQAAGRTKPELLRQSIPEMAPELWAQIEPALGAARAGAVRSNLEVTTHLGTGESPRYWLASLCRVHSASGMEQGVSLSLAEVTGLKETARRLSVSEQRFRSLFELNPDAVFAISPEGRYLDANPACERVTGFTEAELQQRTWMELVDPEDLEGDLGHFHRVLSGEAQYLKTTLSHPDGHRVDLSVTAIPIRVEDQIVGVFGIAEDVTEFNQAQAQLEQQAGLLDLALDPIFAWEPEGPISYWNRAAERLYGYGRNEAVGQNPQLLLHSVGSDGAPYLPTWLQEEEEWRGELRHLTRAGHEIIVESYQLLVRQPDGRSLVLESNRDITERRRAEESVRKQNQALVALAKNTVLTAGDLGQAMREITAVASRTLGVQRVGVWNFDQKRTVLRCVSVYDLEQDRHSSGPVLTVETHPHYFRALEADRVLAVEDAARDPRTCDLKLTYLDPLGIGALLDAPIYTGGRVVGVVCHEQRGKPRKWTPEEQSFAAGIADLIAMACEHVERRRAEKALDEAREQLLRKEVEKKCFTREILRAVTRGKLHLAESDEIPDEVPEAGRWQCELDLREPGNYPLFRDRLREAARRAGMSEARIHELVLAAGEAITNAIKHGVDGIAAMLETPGRIVVRVSDRGPGIRMEDLPATVLEPGYSTKISLGMGFTLLLQLADAIWLATGPAGTVVQFEKKLVEEEPADPVAALLERFSNGLLTE